MENSSQLLTDIRAGIASLKDYIIRPFPDRRIVEADETCSFFQLSGAVRGVGANDKLLSFKVPQSQKGVIAECTVEVNPTGAFSYPAKNEGRLILKTGDNPAAIIATVDCAPLHGSLLNVQQGGNTIGENVDGIATGAGTSRFQCRIPLMSGETYAFYRPNGITISSVMVALWIFGWVWPNTPRK